MRLCLYACDVSCVVFTLVAISYITQIAAAESWGRGSRMKFLWIKRKLRCIRCWMRMIRLPTFQCNVLFLQWNMIFQKDLIQSITLLPSPSEDPTMWLSLNILVWLKAPNLNWNLRNTNKTGNNIIQNYNNFSYILIPHLINETFQSFTICTCIYIFLISLSNNVINHKIYFNFCEFPPFNSQQQQMTENIINILIIICCIHIRKG